MTDTTKAGTGIKERLERLVERTTGKSIESVRNATLEEARVEVERQTGKTISFDSGQPVIGRGSVTRSHPSSKEVSDRLDKSLQAIS